ncbi:MAG TPA: TonB-dependent receptor [Gammaproteobacteria bacterium]
MLLTALALAPCVFAQQQAAIKQGVSIFTLGDFTAAAPTHALDMVSRLPGFAIVEADVDVRGYAGAQGNVLIDGARPSSKREDIKALLKRIPVGSVERIELIRGGVAGIDMAGYVLVANVVRKSLATSETVLQGGLLTADDWAEPQVRIEHGRSQEERALQLAFSVEPELDDATGRGHIHVVAPDGALLENSVIRSRESTQLTQASANWRQPAGGGGIELNLALSNERKQENVELDTLQPEPQRETAHEDEDTDEAEIDIRFSRSLGDRSHMQLLASERRARQSAVSMAREDDDSERFEENTDSGETIVRIDLTHTVSADLDLVAVVEDASNSLDSRAALVENGAPAAPLPGSDVNIEEDRSDVSLGAAWQLSGAWRLEADFGTEASAIQQTGDSLLKRRFVYNKPRLTVHWEAAGDNRFRLSYEREIGQLDFEDFVASAALDTDDVSAGNAQLQPDKTWRTGITWEHGFWDDGALVLSWTHDRISDVVDRVLVTSSEDEIFDAPGNIGDGTRDSVSLELSSSLDRLGLPGFHLAATILWRDSAVRDPVTGETRGISSEAPREGELSLTRTASNGQWSYGVEVELAERETEFQYNEIAREYKEPSWELSAKRRIGHYWQVQAELTDPFGREISEYSREYDGPRTEQLEAVERRKHRMPAQFMLSLRYSAEG